MEEDDEKTFTDYKPSQHSIGPPHPDPVVETSSLSAIQPPEATYSLAIKADLESSKTLSCLQIETLVYASQRHLQHLPSGERAGFFIGDGAGVGKGRTIAGLIWENWRQNRRKSLWISIGSDLKFDARRDLDDVGASCIEVHALNKLPYSKLDSKSVGINEGVIFLTYTALIAHGHGQNRLNQLTQWCGRDFDGLIIFDESHKAKNLLPAGVQGLGTMTGEAVVKIQSRLPQARVVYCSATGASEPRNMAYMVRLGLWGSGTCFREFADFSDAMERGGIGALELVAMEMKARGLYVCRTLSQKGADIEVVEVPLEAKMMQIYEEAAELWAELRRELALALAMESSDDTRQIWRLYWAHHQHFFKHMCASAKVPAVVRLAKQALMDGKCVVIGLQSTGEARTEEAVSKRGDQLDDFIFGPRELLLKFVEENYPLPDIPESCFLRTKRRSDVSLRGRVRKVPKFYRESDIPTEKTEPTEMEVAEARRTHEEGVKRKREILEKIRLLVLPNNPLDEIIDQLGGHDQVAEITGRRGALIKDSSKKGVTYQARNHTNKDVSMEMVNMHEKNLFMDGKKLVAIISEAGSAGVSLQADRRAVNQRRRVHFTLELPWSADKAIQQFGRTHRSNQTSAPEYRMLITNLGGERRFASIVAKRLATLGALTQGDRRAGGGGSLSAYNYESECGKEALKIMYRGIIKSDDPVELPVVIPPGCSPDDPDSIHDFVEEAKTALVSVGITDSKMDDEVGRFLNRILGLPPEMQNRLFEWFVAIFDHVTETARAEGQLDPGILDIRANRVELKEKPMNVHFDSMSGVSTRLFTFTLDHGTTWESAYALMKARRNGDHDVGFYQSKTENSGRRDIVLALDGSSSNFFKIFRPSGESSREMLTAELKHKYSRVPLQIACVGWENEYDLSPKQCVHGPKCKMGKFCEAIRLREEVNVLSGLIFPIWGTIEKALEKQGREIHRQIRVVRVKATSEMSQPVVGLLIPNAAVETLLGYLACIGPKCYSVLNEAYFSQIR